MLVRKIITEIRYITDQGFLNGTDPRSSSAFGHFVLQENCEPGDRTSAKGMQIANQGWLLFDINMNWSNYANQCNNANMYCGGQSPEILQPHVQTHQQTNGNTNKTIHHPGFQQDQHHQAQMNQKQVPYKNSLQYVDHNAPLHVDIPTNSTRQSNFDDIITTDKDFWDQEHSRQHNISPNNYPQSRAAVQTSPAQIVLSQVQQISGPTTSFGFSTSPSQATSLFGLRPQPCSPSSLPITTRVEQVSSPQPISAGPQIVDLSQQSPGQNNLGYKQLVMNTSESKYEPKDLQIPCYEAPMQFGESRQISVTSSNLSSSPISLDMQQSQSSEGSPDDGSVSSGSEKERQSCAKSSKEKGSRNLSTAKLWELLRWMLSNPSKYDKVIDWDVELRPQGVFILKDSAKLELIYNSYKKFTTRRGCNDKPIKLGSITRALRHYYEDGVIEPVNKKYKYRFGSKACEWKTGVTRVNAVKSIQEWEESMEGSGQFQL
ncbi:uncharacterized protein LOC142344371 isoform X2 [Convolutriloba macropyga]|uniref:uncharacterized protein LOC142344371 isoform X2 n=1 Tax=Convolutriloba macropyga TaxID=536237 RepID=UPI003F51B242